MRWLVVGGGAREHAIAAGLHRAGAEVIGASATPNPGIARIAVAYGELDPTNPEAVVALAQRERAAAAIIGPEAPLAAGVADALRAVELPTVGPGRAAARLESSKRFCRELLSRYHVPGQPKVAAPTSVDEVDRVVAGFGGPLVVKPSALTAGKGVWVQGSDFAAAADGAVYAKSILVQGGEVLLEEKLEGEEFSLMAFVTDSGIYPMPAVQDYKRALEGDQGGNTGGMGAYSQRDHLLPFLRSSDRDRALEILERTVAAMRAEGLPYRGILYGGFMMTARGPILLEFNVRFGDPEGINALVLYEEGNLSDLFWGIATGRVDPGLVRFRQRATVLKYVVPPGYGRTAQAGGVVHLDEGAIEAAGVHVFFGSIEAAGPGAVRFGRSRGFALIGEASAIHEAGHRVESALPFLRGSFYVRHDIATLDDLAHRREHMRRLLAPAAKPSPLPLSVAAPDAPPSSAGSTEQVIGPIPAPKS